MGKAQQYITGLAACFAALSMGSLNTWPSYTLDLFTNPNTTVLSTPMTEVQASLVGSLPSLGAMAGTAVTGLFIDKLGRKRGSMALVLPTLLCWIIVQFSSSMLPIMIARFIGGIAGGSNLVYAPIFISEISEPSIRGSLSSGTVTMYCFGAILSYLSGWFLSYRMIIWVNLALGVINLMLFMLVVESPLFLLKKNNEKEALKALAHYRDGSVTSKIVLEELSVMKQQLSPPVELHTVTSDEKKEDEAELAEKEKLTTGEPASPQRQPAIKTLFTDPASRRAFLVVGTVLTLQVCMGMVAVQVYAGNLFAQAAPDLSKDFCSVLLALTLFAGCTVTTVVADKAGRRVLIISSSALVALCMGGLAANMQTGILPAWVSAVVVLLYCFCFIYGAGSVPYVLLAEVFTPEVQSIASMILVEWVWLLNFLIIAVFPVMVSLLTIHGSFYAFACVGIINTVVSYIYVPETKGMSNKQIQELFSK
ncbi:facilitated trehalose transporter Tret1-like [Leguminivora glycinivorella]|uniref:facilitated trehalose transporter Tret1-like n=1 Tax=Leguminivora glycinivorella TaxID=1035111 RepID=UPI00200DB2CA|nr:facilitated trehalose transporter Tret1-like [Leguminivora glycinivorella]